MLKTAIDGGNCVYCTEKNLLVACEDRTSVICFQLVHGILKYSLMTRKTFVAHVNEDLADST